MSSSARTMALQALRAAADSGPYKGIPVGADVPIRPFDGLRTHDTHPHPPPAGAPSPWKGEGLGTWGRNPSVTAAQPLAALPPYGCGVPLAGAAPVPPSPIPFVPSGHFPLIRGIGLAMTGFLTALAPPVGELARRQP